MRELSNLLTVIARQNLFGDLKQKIGASDIVQLSLLRIVDNFEKFNGNSMSELRPWIRKIVINEINRANRSFRTEKRDLKKEQPIQKPRLSGTPTDPLDRELTPSSEAISAERIQLFEAMLDEISAEHAEVIRLRSIEELTFKEIGLRLDRSEAAASKLWFRAMMKLEEKILEHGNFDSL